MAGGCIWGAALTWNGVPLGSTSDVLGPGLPHHGGVRFRGRGRVSLQRRAEEQLVFFDSRSQLKAREGLSSLALQFCYSSCIIRCSFMCFPGGMVALETGFLSSPASTTDTRHHQLSLLFSIHRPFPPALAS